MAIIEIGRDNFASPFLYHLVGGLDFSWYVLPPRDRSSGILVGFKDAVFSVQDVISGDFCIKFRVKNKPDGFLWSLVIVYGAAQDQSKHIFLAELVRICEHESLPMLVAGDFNIVRRPEEKNNSNFDAHWPFVFNAIIESLDL